MNYNQKAQNISERVAGLAKQFGLASSSLKWRWMSGDTSIVIYHVSKSGQMYHFALAAPSESGLLLDDIEFAKGRVYFGTSDAISYTCDHGRQFTSAELEHYGRQHQPSVI